MRPSPGRRRGGRHAANPNRLTGANDDAMGGGIYLAAGTVSITSSSISNNPGHRGRRWGRRCGVARNNGARLAGTSQNRAGGRVRPGRCRQWRIGWARGRRGGRRHLRCRRPDDGGCQHARPHTARRRRRGRRQRRAAGNGGAGGPGAPSGPVAQERTGGSGGGGSAGGNGGRLAAEESISMPAR